jgi:hypothetical protein
MITIAPGPGSESSTPNNSNLRYSLLHMMEAQKKTPPDVKTCLAAVLLISSTSPTEAEAQALRRQ